MLDRLTEKEKGFIKDMVRGNTQTQAVKNNYDVANDGTARVLGSRLMKKEKIYKKLMNVGDGLTNEELLAVHKEGLKATRAMTVDKQLVEVPDYGVRYQYLDGAYKLKSLYKAENGSVTNIGMVLVRFVNNKEDAITKSEREGDTDTTGVQEAV